MLGFDLTFCVTDVFLEQRNLDTHSEERDARTRRDRFQETQDPSRQDDASPNEDSESGRFRFASAYGDHQKGLFQS